MGILSKEEFRICAKGLKAVYPQETFLPDADSMAVWYRLLDDIPYNILSIAVSIHVTSNKFPPTVADLRLFASQLMADHQEVSDLEAWSMVRAAVGKSGYYSEEEFEKLPKLVKKAVGSHLNLKEWSQMPLDTINSVIQSQFLRAYRTIVAREADMQKLRPEIRERLERITTNGKLQQPRVPKAIPQDLQ